MVGLSTRSRSSCVEMMKRTADSIKMNFIGPLSKSMQKYHLKLMNPLPRPKIMLDFIHSIKSR